MHVFDNASKLQAFLLQAKGRQQSIGFVPTMGALHKGHMSLIAYSKLENDLTVCSIYVNPTQFDKAEDLEKYPRLVEQDLQMLSKAGCNAVFLPTDEEMYPGNTTPGISFDFGHLDKVMEGKHRQGHFSGVGIVVSKLFHMVPADRAYFGQKDLQQFAIIRQLVQDLSFGIQLRRCPIVRENDGLAFSSRNLRLSERERYLANKLYSCLQEGQRMILDQEEVERVLEKASESIRQHPDFRLEYFEIVKMGDLLPATSIDGSEDIAICIAAYLGNIRLIDNIIIEKELLPMFNGAKGSLRNFR